MKTVCKKLHLRRGMTLTEMLVALLILSLVTVGVTAGTGTALRVYRQSTAASEAQMLTSTLSTVLMDELRYASDIQADGSFRSETFGERAAVGVDGDGQLTLGGGKLVSSAAYAGLTVQAPAGKKLVDYDGAGTFHVSLLVCKNGENLCETEFSVRALSVPAE